MHVWCRFFVTPSDSVAILAANAVESIPYFSDGLKGVARQESKHLRLASYSILDVNTVAISTAEWRATECDLA